MGDYLMKFQHTFMFEFAQTYFFQRLAPFQVLSPESKQMYDLFELLHQKDKSYLQSRSD